MPRDNAATDRPTEPMSAGRYTPDEIGLFFSALVAARDQLGGVTKGIARDFALGVRGAWIVGMIGRTPMSPNEIAKFLRIGRPLVTSELNALHRAGLIESQSREGDRRSVVLTLTALGESVQARLADALGALLETRLPNCTKAQVIECARILQEFGNPAS